MFFTFNADRVRRKATPRRNTIINIVLQTAWILILSNIHYVSSFLQDLLPRLGPSSLPLLQRQLWRRSPYEGKYCLMISYNGRLIGANKGHAVRLTDLRLTSVQSLNDSNCDDTSLLRINNESHRHLHLSDRYTEGGIGFYVHIPYCRRRCRYCDFAIVPIGIAAKETSSHDDNEQMNLDNNRANRAFRTMDLGYRDAVVSEIKLISKYLLGRQNTHSNSSNCRTEGRVTPLRSIYFGGGTPSLAPIDTIRSILDAIRCESVFPVIDGDIDDEPIEITIEMDPGTFSLHQLQSLKEMGFNRISLGVQSFDDTILESIGRVHRRVDVMDAVDMIGQVYGEDANYSLDLISGLPGLSCAKWVETLQTALSLSPTPSHLSLYDLQIESGTVFGRWYEDSQLDDGDDNDDNDDDDSLLGDLSRTRLAPAINTGSKKKDLILPLPTSEDCAFMYRFASGYLRSKGFEHYEISSYAKIVEGENGCGNKRSRHNQVYWEYEGEWYAVGMGAASSLLGKRFSRPRQLAEYIDWVTKEKEKALMLPNDGSNGDSHSSWIPGWLSGDTHDDDDDKEILLDVIMTRLRTKEGLDLGWIEQKQKDSKFHNLLEKVLHGAELGFDLGILKMTKKDGRDFLHLTDPDGFLFSNTIISTIFTEII